MPTTCCVLNCKNRRKPGDSFHKFPNDEALVKTWLIAIKRTDLKVSQVTNKVVCSSHFEKSMYLDRPGSYKPRLKQDAIPTIFNFEESKVVRRGRKRKREPLSVALTRWGQKRNLEDPPYQPTKVIKQEKTSPSVENGNEFESPLQPTRRSSRPRKILIKKDPWETSQPEVLKPKSSDKKYSNLHLRKHLNREFHSIVEVLQNLKHSNLITNETLSILSEHFSNISLERLQNSDNKSISDGKLFEFALSLYYKSPRAYKSVRKHIKLPHPSTLRHWSFSSNFEPGFLKEAFESLRLKLHRKPDISNCILLVDSMSLNKKSVWEDESSNYVGYVDYGACVIENEENLASEVLVFYLIGLRGCWKSPVAYFLVNTLNPVVLCQLIRNCLDKIADIGFRTLSVVFDEPLKYRRVINMLGCDLFTSVENKHKICNSFKHSTRDYPVHITFDCYCLLQLVRDTLCELKIFIYEKEKIEWQYLCKLIYLIDNGFDSDKNKISLKCEWQKHKMNVKLRRHIFSSEVADALDWLRDSANHPSFSESKATSDFIRKMESLFTILDIQAYSNNNHEQDDKLWLSAFHKFIGYLVKLQTSDGKLLLKHRKSQCLVGLIVTCNSLASIAANLGHLESSLCFRSNIFSLQNLHIFFSYVRGSTEPSPGVLQFKKGLKEYFLLNNCIAFENSDTISTACISRQVVCFRGNYHFMSEFEERITVEMFAYLKSPVSQYRANVLYYIAGYIAKMLLGKLICHECSALLVKDTVQVTSVDEQGYALRRPCASSQERVNSKGFIMASDDTVLLVKLAEKYFHLLVNKRESKYSLKHLLKAQITTAVLSAFVEESSIPYCSHKELPLDPTETPHHLQLIKMVIEYFLTLRLHIL